VALGPVYVLTGRVVYPDSVQFCLLLLNLLALAPLLEREGTVGQWGWFGVTLGAFLNVKGTSLLYLGALGMYTLLWRRDWFRNARAWMSVAIALLLLLPWLAWSAGHGWPSLRLALNQGGGFGMAQPGLLGSLAHAWRYLTPPSALLAAAAALGAVAASLRLARRLGWRDAFRAPPRWAMPALAALLILGPMLLSAANSPRNLALGLLPLWPLAALLPGSRAQQRAAAIAGSVLFALMALYAVGTVMALLGPARLPQSSGAAAVRRDAAGWREYGKALDAPAGDLLYAVDYSIAGQLSYAAQRDVYSSIGQFRYWGAPDAEDWTVIAQGYVPPERVTAKLRAGFAEVSGPEAWTFASPDGEKTVYRWRAEGRRVPTAQLMDDLDYLALARGE
jgi:hypothetical protein